MACANTKFNDQAQPHIALRRARALVLRPGVCHRVTSAFGKSRIGYLGLCVKCGIILLAMTMFKFFSAIAGTWIIAADFGRSPVKCM